MNNHPKQDGGIAAAFSGLEFDIDNLRERYRQERDKRIRPDGSAQWVTLTDELSRYIDDPYVEPGFARAPLTDHMDVVIIGGGIGGLLAGARMREAGIADIRIIDRAGDFGGTWYWNRYPGAACDTESYVYMPLLEETGYIPSTKYASAPEIKEHLCRVGKTFDLYSQACFQTQVTELRWDEGQSRWLISTDRNDSMTASFVIMTNGPLSRPKLPGIPGIESFKGHTFHTSRWDYNYTGGSADGNLAGLADKRVAVIGTGATAIQCVPHLAAHAKHLYVVQRTPSSVDERRNRPTDPEWVKSLTPGWQRRRMQNFLQVTNGDFREEDLVADGWTDITKNLGTIVATTKQGASDISDEDHELLTELADFKKMNALRSRVDENVHDSETAEALKPWFRLFCKRPTFNDHYLAVFNQPNVSLIDTAGRGPDCITAEGIVFAGRQYDVDCIVFATGFEPASSVRSAGFEVYGRGGRALSAYWKQNVRTLHAFCSHGFPNYFHMGATTSAFAFSNTHPLMEQAGHIAYIIEQARLRQVREVEPTVQAEKEWMDILKEKRGFNAFLDQCTPGYYNNEGKLDASGGFLETQYGGGAIEYFQLLQDWRDDGNLVGLSLTQ